MQSSGGETVPKKILYFPVVFLNTNSNTRAMKVKANHVERLLDLLSEKTDQAFDTKGFLEMEAIINDTRIKKKYLYEYLHRGAMKANKTKSKLMDLNIAKLDVLAKYVTGHPFRELSQKIERERSAGLISCVGTYYCYVRRNAAIGVLMRSPVRISEQKGKVIFELVGGRWNYTGEAVLKNGCLFILMKESGGKEIHHVYKLGISERPAVLQGIFSAVSSTFEPIGGRAVLVRNDKEFDQLEKKELNVSDLKKSKVLAERRLAEYFAKYEENNLSIKKADTFRVDDLGICR